MGNNSQSQKLKKPNIFRWAWVQRKEFKIPPDEPRFSMSETINILKRHSDPSFSQKKLRDYEYDDVVIPGRTQGGHRQYSVGNILSLHLMGKGTKYLGKRNTIPIVKLYQLSRRQPTRHNPTVFDYDPSLPGEKKIHDILHKPILESPLFQISQIFKIVGKIDDFLHINDFARKHGIGFKCFDDELLIVKRAGMSLKITPPLTEWRSVKKAIQWRHLYIAKAKINEQYPKHEKGRNKFEEQINHKIISWLVQNNYAVKLK